MSVPPPEGSEARASCAADGVKGLADDRGITALLVLTSLKAGFRLGRWRRVSGRELETAVGTMAELRQQMDRP